MKHREEIEASSMRFSFISSSYLSLIQFFSLLQLAGLSSTFFRNGLIFYEFKEREKNHGARSLMGVLPEFIRNLQTHRFKLQSDSHVNVFLPLFNNQNDFFYWFVPWKSLYRNIHHALGVSG